MPPVLMVDDACGSKDPVLVLQGDLVLEVWSRAIRGACYAGPFHHSLLTVDVTVLCELRTLLIHIHAHVLRHNHTPKRLAISFATCDVHDPSTLSFPPSGSR